MLASISGRVNTFLLALLVLMAAAVLAVLARRAGAGPLDPPGGVTTLTSTQTNLIFQPADCAGFPITISVSGSYKLAEDIIGCPGADGIDITSSRVTLDLDGHYVTGAGPGSGIGINAQPTFSVITNGYVTEWGSDGVQTGRLASHLVVTGNIGRGIVLTQSGAVARDNEVSSNYEVGIYADEKGQRIEGNTVGSNASLATLWPAANILISGNGDVVVEDNNVSTAFTCGAGILMVGNHGRIVRNLVTDSQGTGIRLTYGSETTIADNTVSFSGWGGGACGSRNGIRVELGAFNVIQGNHIIHNFGATDGGLTVLGASNTIIGNVARANSPTNYSVAAGNDVGPIGAAATASAWANIDD